MIRMPSDTYDQYMRIKFKMETDLHHFTGKPVRMSNTTFFGTLINLNENVIEVDLPKLSSIVNNGRRRRSFL
jgi:hypothetical protein